MTPDRQPRGGPAAMIRPDLRAAFWRWREVFAGLGVALAGLWVTGFGGWFWAALGALVIAGGGGVALMGWRRLRFGGAGAAPGVVQVVEGQIAYFGPRSGGFVAIADITALSLAAGPDGPEWRLAAEAGGLAIPTDAAGGEALFDAFASLPGIDMAAVTAARSGTPSPSPPAGSGGGALVVHDPRLSQGRVLWRRAAGPRRLH